MPASTQKLLVKAMITSWWKPNITNQDIFKFVHNWRGAHVVARASGWVGDVSHNTWVGGREDLTVGIALHLRVPKRSQLSCYT